MPQDYKLTF